MTGMLRKLMADSTLLAIFLLVLSSTQIFANFQIGPKSKKSKGSKIYDLVTTGFNILKIQIT